MVRFAEIGWHANDLLLVFNRGSRKIFDALIEKHIFY